MSNPQRRPEIQTEMMVRVLYAAEPGQLARVLQLQRLHGGALRAHLVHRVYERCTGLFLCDEPAPFALALQQAGYQVDTETVVAVHDAGGPEALSFLVQTLEAEGLAVGYTFATSEGAERLLIFRTTDNPKAEDILRGLLHLEDPAADLKERARPRTGPADGPPAPTTRSS